MQKVFLLILAFLLLVHFSKAQEEPILSASDSIYVVINEINVFGNAKTLDKVILAESKIEIGDSISLSTLAKELKESRQNILNTSLFNDVKIRLASYNGYEVDLNINVWERWYIYPLLIFQTPGLTFSEWREETNSDFDRVAYGLRILHLNNRKRAEKAQIHFKTGFEEQAGFSYVFTGFGKERRVGAGISIARARQKGAIVSATDNLVNSELYKEDALSNTSLGASISFRQNLNTRHSLGYRFSSIDVEDFVLGDSPEYFANGNNSQSNHNLAYGLQIEHRDLIEYPLNGYALRSTAGYEGFGTEDLDILTLQTNVSYYKPLAPKFYASAQVSGRLISGSPIPFYNAVKKRINDDALRGYEDYRLFPQSYAIIQTELRYELLNKSFDKVPILPKYFEPLPLRIYPKVFFDAGRLHSKVFAEQNQLNDDFLYSFGAGIDIITIYNTPLRIEFSRNHLKENNISFGFAKTF